MERKFTAITIILLIIQFIVYQPIPFPPSQIIRSCTNCGVILKGNFCHECGQKVEL